MSMALPLRARPALRLAASVIAFQGAWFVCVLSAARGASVPGLVAVAAAVAWLVIAGGHRKADLLLIGAALLSGVVADTLLAHFDVVRYAAPWPASPFAPAWILALWALWGAVLREPLRWLHGRPVGAALLGGVGGPLSYAAAARMGACSFPDVALAMVVLGAVWAIVTPVHLAFAARLDRREAAR
jgi:uncharacterized protein DUF2878